MNISKRLRSTIRRKSTSFLALALIIITPLMPGITGCDALGLSLGGIKGRVEVNTDPDDPQIAKFLSLTGDMSVVFFGQKDADGNPTVIESAQYFGAGATQPFNAQFDAQSRPTLITTPEGAVATFTYDGNNVSVTFKNTDGTVSVDSFPLDEQQMKRIHADSQEFVGALRDLSKVVSMAQKKTTVKIVRGFVHLNLTVNGQAAGTVKDAKVSATATNADGFIPVAYNSGADRYEMAVAHRVEDLSVLISECETRLYNISQGATGAGVVLVILGFICVGTTGGLCGFILHPLMAILAGVGLGGTSYVASRESLDCRGTIIAAAVKSGQGKQTVTVNASHPILKFNQNAMVMYDVFDSFDPVTANGFEITYTIPIQASILNVRTSPGAPAAGESYSVVFDIAPANASVTYTISGTDGFSKTETLVGDGTTGSVTSGSIPGGAKGVTDTISADILVGGAKVGSSTPVSITFR